MFYILSLRKSMGGIVIDIWEKSNFFGSIGSQKGAENVIFIRVGHLKPPPLMVGLTLHLIVLFQTGKVKIVKLCVYVSKTVEKWTQTQTIGHCKERFKKSKIITMGPDPPPPSLQKVIKLLVHDITRL